MSRTLRPARRPMLAALGAAAALGLAAPAAGAADLSLDFTCDLPLVGEQPLTVDLSADLPASVRANVPTGSYALTAKATAGGQTYAALAQVGAKTLEGVALGVASINGGSEPLPVGVPIGIAEYAIPATPGPLVLDVAGETTAVVIPEPGRRTITVDALMLNLVARDAAGTPIQLPPVGVDADEDPDTFNVGCSVDAGQENTLATLDVTA